MIESLNKAYDFVSLLEEVFLCIILFLWELEGFYDEVDSHFLGFFLALEEFFENWLDSFDASADMFETEHSEFCENDF